MSFLGGSYRSKIRALDYTQIKAAGVTFVKSMLERVIEERARGNPDAAAAIRW